MHRLNMGTSLSTATTSFPKTKEAARLDCHQAAGLQLARALSDVLGDLQNMLGTLPPSVMADASLDTAFASTVGKHVRHTIDHVRALRQAATGECACYEARQRGDVVESDPHAAANELAALREFLLALTADQVKLSVTLEQATFRDCEPAILTSTLVRELGFVYGHTIHHLAMMRMLLSRLGGQVQLPATLGYAPGTPAPATSLNMELKGRSKA